MGLLSASIVAPFTEMNGVPLTTFLLSGWLQSRFPGPDPLSRDAGHRLELLWGWSAKRHFDPLHLLSGAFISGGFLPPWPTILTVTLLPVLVGISLRLARREEQVPVAEFGDEYTRYADRVSGFIPRLRPDATTPGGRHADYGKYR